MAKVRIGCGWYVLATLGVGWWAASKWAPNHLARAKAAVAAKAPKVALPWSKAATPSPAPTPQLATPAPTPPGLESTPEPTPEVLPSPQESPPLADVGGAGDGAGKVSFEDLRPGTGRAARVGQSVRIRCALLGSANESLGGSSDFLFMVGAGEVARGLDDAVAGMKVGGKRRATIPAVLAKGALPPGLEPGTGELRCEIELAEVL
jgi:hypothetical protein